MEDYDVHSGWIRFAPLIAIEDQMFIRALRSILL